MKTDKKFEELVSLSTRLGVTVRKDRLIRSNGGYCVINEDKVIVLNKMLPLETQTSILARCLFEVDGFDKQDIDKDILSYIKREVEYKKITDEVDEIEFIITNKDDIDKENMINL
ncbi:MAG: hypothetical protein GX372_07990 [Ignavibacteria bacterium]|nr:hypothetical protein [Ignavibacteria bacterium]